MTIDNWAYFCCMKPLRQQFLQHNAQTSTAPLLLEFSRAKGSYLYDAAGKPYLDFISGISVSNVGHGHPKVVQAIQEQAAQHLHLMVYGEFVQAPQVRFAEALAQSLPVSLQSVYFTNSGAEAVEGALKLAKRSTGRQQILSFHHSYHGSTHGALSVMGNEEYKYAFRPLLPHVSFLDFGKMQGLERINTETACVIVEAIQGEAGVVSADLSWWKALRQRCTETGTLLVLDEIQTGFGRAGSLWAFEQLGIVPDILLLGKALGGGMPLGAFISAKERMDTLSHDPVLGHISTFAGHPLCCAAGLAAFQVLKEEQWVEKVAEKEALICSELKGLELRGKGLIWAIELGTFERNKAVIDACITQGLITDWFLHNSSSLRMAPPLTISIEDLLKGLRIIRQVVSDTK